MEAKWSTPRNQLSYFDSSLIYKCDIKDSIDELASNSENSIDFKDHPFVQINSNMDMKEEKLKDFVATAVDTLGTPTNFIPNETKVIKSHRSLDQFDLSKREDVLNKGAIRAIRKYYRDEFKQRYKSIVKKRICNCDYSDIITASEEFCRNLFPSSLWNEDLFCYMAGILKLWDVKNLNCSSYIKIEVGEFVPDIITASEEFCRNLFPSSLWNEDLFCYMAGILKLWDVKNLNCSSYIKIEVGEFLNLVRSYSLRAEGQD